MTQRTDSAKTITQGHSEQQIRLPHLHQLWRCSTKSKMLHSYKTTVYTIFRFNLSFQLWESANSELSRPERRKPLLHHQTFTEQQDPQSQRSLTLEVEQRWRQNDLMERDTEIPVRNVSSPGISPQKFRGWGVNYQWRK